MKEKSYIRNLVGCLIVLPLSVSLLACSTQSGSYDTSAKVNIPDLPPSVRHTEPKLANKALKDSKDTTAQLEEYENANRKNKIAIQQAKAHNKKLQQIYNAPPKKEEGSSITNPLTWQWKMW